MSPAPLVIRTTLFIDTLADNHTLNLISGGLSIYLAPYRTRVPADVHLYTGKALPAALQRSVLYRWYKSGEPPASWKPLPLHTPEKENAPYAGRLVETAIGIDETWILECRLEQDSVILQQTLFSRNKRMPVITGYRQKNARDTVNAAIVSASVRRTHTPGIHFETLKENTVTIRPGKHPEILFTRAGINFDSCIEYRLYDPSKRRPDTTWARTGHLLALPKLKGDKEYVLDARYRDMTATGNWRIIAQPYWYQANYIRVLFLSASLLLITGIPYSFYRFALRRERRKRIRLQEQIRTVQSQLNPHFVYNALSSIGSLISTKQNELANTYLSSFSDIMRKTLKNSSVLLVNLEQDMEMLRKYIRIEQLRFGFLYNLHIDPALDLTAIDFPPMLLQPSIENSVRHALSHRGKKGMLSVAFMKNDTDLVVTVSDNGPGPSHANGISGGYGTKLTRERIDNLNRLYKTVAIIYDLQLTPQGARATFLFKNWLD